MKIKIGRFLMTLLLLIGIHGFTQTWAKASDQDEILQTCANMFGPQLDEAQNLFEVNQFYVLRVKIDKGGNVEELAIEPKFYYEESHPEWGQTEEFQPLTKAEYENLVQQMDEIKPKGRLVKPAPAIGFVTNCTAWWTEKYEKASLTWGQVVDIRRGEDAPEAIKWFRIDFGKGKKVRKVKAA